LLRYALNDLIRNKGVNTALAVLLILSAFLTATGSMVMERLIGSVDQLFDDAQPPHYLQMHTGDYDPEELDRFAGEHPEIEAWQVAEMLGFDGAAIAWQRPATGESGDLSESLIDNLVTTQQQEFDFLLDETGAIPQPSNGEVYVPVAYRQSFELQAGDELAIATDAGVQELRIAGFVRDAQMASSLSSATRFLVSDEDFEALEATGAGAAEIIVEYRLTDASVIPEFQSAYEADDALPKNGQAVTYPMIRLINAFSDGLVALAMVFFSLLLIAIALLNLRFVIRGTVEEEVREIGAMKAIGIPDKTIVGLYLAKYRVMTLAACLLGGALGVIASHLLTQGIQANYAEAPVGLWSVVVPALALLVVYAFVIAVCRGVLRAVRRVQVVNALVHGSTLGERQTARRAKRQARRVRRTDLASYRGGNIGRRLALVDLRAESRQWILIPIVFALTAMLITLPLNLLSTFENPRFITYMGAAESDLRADLQFSENVDAEMAELLASLREDDRITDVRAFANVLHEAEGEDGWETLRVEVGDYSTGTVEFLEGRPPETGEIALSVLNAEKYLVSVGEELTVRGAGESNTLAVSGIYQDVTSGGHTAKMHGEVTDGAAGYVIYADTAQGTDPAAVAAEYNEHSPAAGVIPMRDYVQQTLSYVTDALRNAAVLAFVFGVGVAVVITSLFLKLRLTTERRTMGILSSLGFSMGEIIAQVRGKTLLAMVTGTLLGLALTASAGELLVGLLLSAAGLGLASLDLMPDPLLAYVASPLILLAAGYLASVALTARLRRADTSLWLREG
jgi:putative ABC transport system permease protein